MRVYYIAHRRLMLYLGRDGTFRDFPMFFAKIENAKEMMSVPTVIPEDWEIVEGNVVPVDGRNTQ